MHENSIFFGPLTLLLSILCVFMRIASRANGKKKKEKKGGGGGDGKKEKKKRLRMSNFTVLLVVFKCHHGSERVNMFVFM